MRILWVSRHPMHGVQMGALRRLFGTDVRVEEEARPFDSAEQIVKRAREGSYDDVIVVAPLSVLARMVDLGLRPLWSEAEITPDDLLGLTHDIGVGLILGSGKPVPGLIGCPITEGGDMYGSAVLPEHSSGTLSSLTVVMEYY